MRTRWLAFHKIDAAVNEFMMMEDKMEKLQVTLEEWIEMSPELRDLKRAAVKNLPAGI